MSDKMTVTGYTANAQGYLEDTTVPIDSNMPFTADPATSGMPITISGYFGMLFHFYQYLSTHPEIKDFFQESYSIEFSKASLFRVLSQKGCEFVRFHFAIPESNNKLSLLAEGVDINRRSIGYEVLLEKAQANNLVTGPGDPNVEERGNGGETAQTHIDLFEALKAGGSPFGAVTPGDLLQ